MQITKVSINGIEYDVKIVKKLEGNIVGMIDPIEYEITLELGSEKKMLTTLIHEVIHAMLFANGYELGTKSHNEQLVVALANGVYTFIKNNPEIIKEILEN